MSFLNIIPQSSPIYSQLKKLTDAKIVIFSGLPGVGKSLYINAFKAIAEDADKEIDMIQWDVARKAFETDYISSHCPMGDGTVHNGLKLIAGLWLMDVVKEWINFNKNSKSILLIEAPLVGNRFIELMHEQLDDDLESYLSSELCQVVVPIPSKKVRSAIEAERQRQVSEDAKVWSGAKPSVMLMLWKDTCVIANEFGKEIYVSAQPPYDPEIYNYVYSKILKHRNFVPLHIDEIFEVPNMEEDGLHDHQSMHADQITADTYGKKIIEKYNDYHINELVDSWYHT
ncbi:hypothetical protein N9L92_05705 [Saprospiraceae bacterium]|nr:hypothetical protein [Saprospiraceae bacterium]